MSRVLAVAGPLADPHTEDRTTFAKSSSRISTRIIAILAVFLACGVTYFGVTGHEAGGVALLSKVEAATVLGGQVCGPGDPFCECVLEICDSTGCPSGATAVCAANPSGGCYRLVSAANHRDRGTTSQTYSGTCTDRTSAYSQCGLIYASAPAPPGGCVAFSCDPMNLAVLVVECGGSLKTCTP